MTTICERRGLRCPPRKARAYLHEILDEASHSIAPLQVRLTVPIPATKAKLAKDVRLEYAPELDSEKSEETWHLHWTPERGGIYPTFDGELALHADARAPQTVLELRGRYIPPLGRVGEAFDSVIGSKIASATAQQILTSLSEVLERRCNRDEMSKVETK